MFKKSAQVGFLTTLLLLCSWEQAQSGKVLLGNVRRHQNWISAKVTMPNTGKFVAGRASTPDQTQKHALVVDYRLSEDQRHCLEKTVLFLHMRKLVSKDEQYSYWVELTFDNEKVETHLVKLTIPKGDDYAVMELPPDFDANAFADHKTLLVNIRGVGWLDFSLLGFREAQTKAQEECRSFLQP